MNTWLWKVGRLKFYFRNNWWNFHVWVYDKDQGEMIKDYGKEYCLTFFIPHFMKKWLTNRYIKKHY